MAITVGIDTGGHVHGPRRGRRRERALACRQGALEPGQPGRRDRRLAGRRRLRSRRRSSFVVVGTTIGINAVLTRRGARVVYLTTEGFQDVPHIQRINRKHHYDFHWRKPTPLVHRPDCLGVAERMDEEGACSQRDRPRGARERARGDPRGRAARLPAVAICFLFSYLNPEHELAARGLLAQRFPQLAVSLSHEVAPIWREYERGTTVTVDAYLKPLFERYVDGVSQALEAKGTGGTVGAAQVERRSRARGRGARAARAPAALGHRGRRDRRRLRGARGRGAAGDRARHGRHELRRLPDRGRRAALLRRTSRSSSACRSACRASRRARSAPAAARSAGSTRAASCRSARRARAPCPARPATARAATAPRSPTPTSCSAASTPPSSWAARSRSTAELARGVRRRARRAARARPRRGGLGDGADLQREHGQRDPHRHGRAGHRPARVRAGRVRRRRRDARLRDRRRDRHAPRRRAAAPGPLLRLRRARRDRARRRRAQRLPDRPQHVREPSSTALFGELEAQAQADVAAQGLVQKPAVRRFIAMRYQGQNYEQEVAVPSGTVGRAGAGRGLRRVRAPLRGLLRLPPRRHPDRARAAARSSRIGEPPVFAAPARARTAEGEGPARRDVYFPETGFVPTEHRAPPSASRPASRGPAR